MNDQNLLLGILALQLDFIERDQLIDALHQWVLDKAVPLNQILVRQGALPADAEPLLLAVLEKHLELHDNDLEKSLQSVSSLGSVRGEMLRIQDETIAATLAATSAGEDGPTARDKLAASERFRILRPHARGGLGEVNVAMDAELNREVALKLIQQRFASDSGNRNRFVAEAEITGGLEHPGIVPVYGLGTHADGRPFYAMRFIRGDSLQEAAQRFHDQNIADKNEGILELRKLLGRFIDVCHAIEYAHSRGVLHRDLKPGNIMLGRFGETLVVDWGLAKSIGKDAAGSVSEEETLLPVSSSGSVTELGSAIGTPAYMSPEQAAGQINQMGRASDVYGLGSTLFFLLTGHPPVTGENTAEILRKVQAGNIRTPRDVRPTTPRALDAICRKAMALEPDQRYASPHELAEEIERWLADEPVLTFKEPVLARTNRWIRQHQTVVTAGVLVGIVFVLASLTIAWQSEEARKRIAEEKRLAEAAQTASERNFGRALDSVELMLTRVGNEQLADVPFLSEVRRELLEDALAFYLEMLSEQDQALPSIRLQAARSHGILSRCYVMLGQFDEAGKHLLFQSELLSDLRKDSEWTIEADRMRLDMLDASATLATKQLDLPRAISRLNEALALFDSIPPGSMDVTERRVQQGRLFEQVGLAWSKMGNFEKAVGAFEHSEQILNAAVDADPLNEESLYALQALHHSFGSTMRLQSKMDDAAAHFQLAMKKQQTLFEIAGKDPILEFDHANTLSRLAVVVQLQGKYTEAEKLWKDSSTTFQRLAQDFPAVRHYSTQAAASRHNLGELFVLTNRAEEAVVCFEESIAALRKLQARGELQTQELGDLANSYMRLSSAQMAAADLAEAESAMKQAKVLWLQTIDQAPEAVLYQVMAAASQHNLADVLVQSGIYQEAEENYRASIERLDSLEDETANLPGTRGDKANSWLNLARVFQLQGKLAEAAEAFEHGATELEDLVATTKEPRLHVMLAGAYHNHGTLLQEQDQMQAAIEKFDHSIDLLTKAMEAFPEVPIIQRDLANSEFERAETLFKIGNKEAATVALEAAVVRWAALNDQFPNTPDLMAGLALSQVRQLLWRGQLDEAYSTVVEFQQNSPQPSHQFLAALLLLQCCDDFETDDRVEAWRSQSIAWIRAAAEGGALTVEQLAGDAGLESIREDHRLLEIMESLRMATDADKVLGE